MGESSENRPLLQMFPPHSKAGWLELIRKDLGGKDFDETLVWHSPEGIAIQPAYTREDLAGKTVYQPDNWGNQWLMRQNFEPKDVADALTQINRVKKQDFDAIGFQGPGLKPEDLGILAEAAREAKVQLYIRPEANFTNWIDALRHGKDDNTCGLDTDWPKLDNAARQAMATCLKAHPKALMRIFHLDGDALAEATPLLHEHTAALLHQLDSLLAWGLENDINPEAIVKRLTVTITLSPDYFSELARLRALRMLLENVMAAYLPNGHTRSGWMLHAATSFAHRNTDPYRNLLQNTTIGMAATSGGADMLSLDMADSDADKGPEFFERIARNIQLLLKHESHFDIVADPAGGSYFVETLTEELAEKAWSLFQKQSDTV